MLVSYCRYCRHQSKSLENFHFFFSSSNSSGGAIPGMGCTFMHNGTKSTVRIQWKSIHIDGHLQWILFNLLPECIHVSNENVLTIDNVRNKSSSLKWSLKFKLGPIIIIVSEPTHPECDMYYVVYTCKLDSGIHFVVLLNRSVLSAISIYWLRAIATHTTSMFSF